MRKPGFLMTASLIAIFWAAALPVPAQDAQEAADPPQLARFPGARIQDYDVLDYDSFSTAISDALDGRIPRRFQMEGRITRIRYAIPPGKDDAGILRHYNRLVRKAGFRLLYQCQDARCGGEQDHCATLPPDAQPRRRMIASKGSAETGPHLCLEIWSGSVPARTSVDLALVAGRGAEEASDPASSPVPAGEGGFLNPTVPVEDCDRRRLVCIRKVPFAEIEGFELWAATRLPGDVTVTVKTRLENLESSEPGTLTAVVRTGKDKLLTKLTPVIFGQPWRHFYIWDYKSGRPDAVHDPNFPYMLPFARGVRAYVRHAPGGKWPHRGAEEQALDFSVATGTVVMAARGGQVVDIRRDETGPQGEGEGRSIIIEHSDGTVARYFSQLLDLEDLAVGSKVKPGDALGRYRGTGSEIADRNLRPDAGQKDIGAGIAHARASRFGFTGGIVHLGVYIPVDGMSWRSVPIRFELGGGVPVPLQEGREYRRF